MNNTVTTQEARTVKENREPRQERRGWLQPSVNIVENEDGYVLEAEMPGVNKDDLEVLLEGNELTIVGKRTSPVDGLQTLYRESYERDFRRSFELDPTIDTKKISARMEHGLLTLELPKAEEIKPRKIAVE
jgi:HSP20 family protein